MERVLPRLPRGAVIVTVFGVRHHGPGSARSLRAALQELAPDIVLVEGPPEGDALLSFMSDTTLHPPVALLVYRPDQPRRATFFPLAEFSPEWQALQYAAEHSLPARFCDLPQAISLAREPDAPPATDLLPDGADGPPDEQQRDAPGGAPSPVEMDRGHEGAEQEDQARSLLEIRDDPIGALAEAAGYSEGEVWWEEEIERRQDARGMFEAILEAMAELRAMAGEETDDHERRREAWMRKSIRQAEDDGFTRVAVVCGAWHAPALAVRPSIRSDAVLLAGLERVKVEAAWIPWTHARLARDTGYGAGIASPGWYHHLWTLPHRSTAGWIAKAARLLRMEQLDAPASGVIDGIRLAETLAALRGRRQPGLTELRESIQTVLCAGEHTPMDLIRVGLEVGDVMGQVPDGAPAVPLQRDVEEQQRRLRLKPAGTVKKVDLDLRKETDRKRSLLLHRLSSLEIAWGKLEQTHATAPYRRGGTFHEIWQLEWHVEFPLLLIEKSVWGNTLLNAADAYLQHRPDEADLPQLTELLRQAAVAELPAAVSRLLEKIGTQSAVTADTRHLMDAILPLAQVARYGDVRGTDTIRVLPILQGLFERVLVALPGAGVGIDDTAASGLLDSMARLHESVNLLDRSSMREAWSDLLHDLARGGDAHPMIRGWCCRLLFEGKRLDAAALERFAGLALSRGAGAHEGASWMEGLLRGPGLVLLHQDGLWLALDRWLQTLQNETFEETLPLLRRAFSAFQPPERRSMGEKIRRLRADVTDQPAPTRDDGAAPIARERAARVIPTLATILGVEA